MRALHWSALLLVPLAVVLLALPAIGQREREGPGITWKKTHIDKAFRSEGVTVLDVNKDGKLDITNGEMWYEAPDWKPHEIRASHKFRPEVYKALTADKLPEGVIKKLGALRERHYAWAEELLKAVGGVLTKEEFKAHKDKILDRTAVKDYTEGDKNLYSNSFACWAEDINGDGYQDVIVIGFPGAPCHWFENPKGKEGPWKKHEIWHSACNETPQYADLFGTGKRVLIMGWQPRGKGNMGQMAYFTPGKDPTQTWEMHPISAPSQDKREVPGTQRFSHGLGVGDVNGDKRLDVICTGGWWEQPEKPDGKTPWKFHPAQLGGAVADMHAYDMNGDGKADIVATSAHRFGIWCFDHRGGKEGASPSFTERVLFRELLSETHALNCADIDGDGTKDFITGKRWWSHGRAEPGSDWPAMIYWFQASKRKDGLVHLTPRIIDTNSGVGTQFYVGDVNGDGLLDVVTSNKKGTFLFEQVRAKK